MPPNTHYPRAILVSLDKGDPSVPVSELMDELALLLENLNLPVIRKVTQKREREDPATYIGKGKAEELKEIALQDEANLIVFDASLTPIQVKNLKEKTGRAIWDRPWVIMEVFRRRARTSEAKLQVELARYRYEIPHLKGLGAQMSRTGAGIATRGPGETEFERHRRKLERRIRDIEEKLAGIRQRRANQRKRRKRSGIPLFSLMGYTNAGKSTLFQALSGDLNVSSKDQLFTTLDTTVRNFRLPESGPALLTDTVGFLRNLPPALLAAFRATLEEVLEADALIWVVDATSSGSETLLLSVETAMKELGAWDIPRIVAINKIDLLQPGELEPVIRKFRRLEEHVVPLCAKSGQGLEELLREMELVVLEQRVKEERTR